MSPYELSINKISNPRVSRLVEAMLNPAFITEQKKKKTSFLTLMAQTKILNIKGIMIFFLF